MTSLKTQAYLELAMLVCRHKPALSAYFNRVVDLDNFGVKLTIMGGIVEIMLSSFFSPVNKFELGKQIFPYEQGILSGDFPSDELD
ncbi:hypothetical protein ACTXT7_012886 [Hymenolepis weldensis]